MAHVGPGTLLRRGFGNLETSIPRLSIRGADASGLAGALNLGLDDAAERCCGLVQHWCSGRV